MSKQLIPCARCGALCVLRSPVARIDYALVTLNAATTKRGMCACCAAHWWFFTLDAFRWVCQEENGPGWITAPMQEALSRVLAIMHPELGALDWGKLLRQWDLPWPDDWRLPV